MENFAFA